ncbi:RlmE family RNA methyltransferase [Achromobacter xylosoxidans]
MKLAQQKGYRARAAFKLIEILDTEKLMRRGDRVVDLGSAPGSWSQVARERWRGRAGSWTGASSPWTSCPWSPWRGGIHPGRLPRGRSPETIGGNGGIPRRGSCYFRHGPNLSGVGIADAARIQHVCELAMEFSCAHLKPNGVLIVKAFHGSGFSQIVQSFKQRFKRVVERKPKASRDKSSETFLVARDLK